MTTPPPGDGAMPGPLTSAKPPVTTGGAGAPATGAGAGRVLSNLTPCHVAPVISRAAARPATPATSAPGSSRCCASAVHSVAASPELRGAKLRPAPSCVERNTPSSVPAQRCAGEGGPGVPGTQASARTPGGTPAPRHSLVGWPAAPAVCGKRAPATWPT